MTEQDFYYDFQDSLAKGKEGEKKVFEHLRKKNETLAVKDLSDLKGYQSLGVDGIRMYKGENGIAYATFFDVKTDFYVHRNNKLFIETGCSNGKDGNMISTVAEYFFYYDPVGGKLYQIPIYPLRTWYNSKGLARRHLTVKNKEYETEGITMTIDELSELFPIHIEDIAKL